ncbi:MAG TPA: hypothetical protein PLK36_06485 [Methanoregulaceae archaeon]|nr:hypothetical protein [Methanoregulaceae archaeon]HNO08616.1 hypothetical protein [Methanoregulaceae archaeon]HPA07907.1 hypothetical protein [Methanoregulaceae archaeon]HQN89707.1 hypothetical protein [Methanoregulaceae archaeon]
MKNQFYYEKYPEDVGFVNDIGAHTARTIMVKELTLLFNATYKDSPFKDIRYKVINENILHKKSISGREKSFSFLKRMYSLDQNLPIYNALRWAWSVSDSNEHSLIALLCALSRDTSLRITAPYIHSLLPGKRVDKEKISSLIEQAFPNRYSQAVIASMTRNLLSSWTQSGHLHGLAEKTRIKANSNVGSCIFAVALGHLAGYRGRMLLDTIWIRTLDATDYDIQEYLQRAMKKGWIRYKQSGGMMEISLIDEIFRKGVKRE